MDNQISIDELTVLLVEPSKTQQKLICQHLMALGLGAENILHVANGQDSITEMTNFNPDLVISAMYLPDMTGTDLVQTMRSTEASQNIPYMLISSETSFRALDPIRQAGAIAILPKPFEREQLEHALYNTVEIIDPQALEFEDQAPEELEVLVVDDSSTARRYIMRVLNGLGIEKITQAKNGVEAIEIMKGAYFDFIVTDYNMPEMDGQELVKQVRNQSAQASIPIIMVTSETDESRLAAVQNTGVSAICDKPFEPNTVRGLIENILHH